MFVPGGFFLEIQVPDFFWVEKSLEIQGSILSKKSNLLSMGEGTIYLE